MSEFTVTVFRFAFFVILWLFVFGVAGVLRRDIFGAKRGTHKPRKAKNSQDSARQSAPAPSRPAPQPRPTPAPPRANPGSIRVTAGPLAGTSLILSGAPVTFGRAPDNTIVIGDDFASSHHARIIARGGAWVLEDLSSTNGTFVDGSKITAPFDLGIGNQITIGHTTLETQS
ncbi:MULTISPECIES: FHA domain-containing protein FhaB/FipA [Brevibacterium]|uniref:FHA domain-containing protein n=2 Tax=Brevibacterium casei TaxID=33889 RepID=K9AJ32_9MICO|nr:FHA domain-containing protein [Brevibacterium casei]NJE67050.1 FHA domain-containing protein [Brevibacterium sp. LS14]EKU46111.1 FHA domain-containing protein [Brevibacterium casei S18]QPR38890.1 FHA domain-containing protein [Brevibacterium casei]QPR43056.1 FHA domain-containing protein [Brevibacterium casei]SMX83963.1 Forkhead associated (FHA) domain, binds pSer, pThr, pTyr [Brevibacterium casei CIP 102111]